MGRDGAVQPGSMPNGICTRPVVSRVCLTPRATSPMQCGSDTGYRRSECAPGPVLRRPRRPSPRPARTRPRFQAARSAYREPDAASSSRVGGCEAEGVDAKLQPLAFPLVEVDEVAL